MSGDGEFHGDLRLGFNRIAAGAFPQNTGRSINREVGLPEISSNPRDFGLSQITITGYSQLGDELHNPQHSATSIYQAVDTATWVRSRHLIKAGFDVRWIRCPLRVATTNPTTETAARTIIAAT